MAYYYVNKNEQITGEHEVHTSECHRLPDPINRITLGYFSNAIEAVNAAQRFYSNVDGCYYCSPEAHKK